jgi:MFS family permease
LIGIGGEYPAGSVGCAESTGELKEGTRNKWFILFTNVQIDLAFFISAIVATVVVLATGENHLRAAWRICLGIGIIPPLSLLYLRLKLQEPEAFKRESMAKAKTPYLLIIKYYWFRLSIVSIIWFIYDFSAYSFGIYATSILANLLGPSAPLWKSLAWNILINFFYMPGCLAGAFVADMPSMGPKKTLFIGVTLQGIIGFIMTGCYPWLNTPENVAGFVVVYGVFLALGEFGPGDNIGLVASKTCATGIRYVSIPLFLHRLWSNTNTVASTTALRLPSVKSAPSPAPMRSILFRKLRATIRLLLDATLSFWHPRLRLSLPAWFSCSRTSAKTRLIKRM